MLFRSSGTYPYWVVDVQGAELDVLKGSGSLLDQCKFLELEVSTNEFYQGQPKFNEIQEWLRLQGFFAIWEPSENLQEFENYHDNILFLRRT